MNILSEKPISDNLADIIETYKLLKKSKIKMAVTQNYRYESPILTLKSVLERGRLGRIDYIVSRYASDYRKPRSWDVGSVYEMENPLLFEGSVHHFDMIRSLSKSDVKILQEALGIQIGPLLKVIPTHYLLWKWKMALKQFMKEAQMLLVL